MGNRNKTIHQYEKRNRKTLKLKRLRKIYSNTKCSWYWKKEEFGKYIALEKPILAGFISKAKLIPALAQKNEFLKAAVEVCTKKILFSSRSLRKCDCKNSFNEKEEKYLFNIENKNNQKVLNKERFMNEPLRWISQKEYEKLPIEVQKCMKMTFWIDKRGQTHYEYIAEIPNASLCFCIKPYYFTKQFIPDNEKISENEKNQNYLQRNCLNYKIEHELGFRQNFWKEKRKARINVKILIKKECEKEEIRRIEN